MPDDVKSGKTLARIKQEDGLIRKIRSGELSGEPHVDLGQSNTFSVSVGSESFEVHVAQIDSTPIFPGLVAGGAPMAAMPVAAAPVAAASAAPAVVEGTPLKAPMPGVVIRYDVKEGDVVEKGQKIMLLEAMKMENSLTAPASGTILKLYYRAGENVDKDAVLLTVGG
jgi:pyruvate carboxylase subunit B